MLLEPVMAGHRWCSMPHSIANAVHCAEADRLALVLETTAFSQKRFFTHKPAGDDMITQLMFERARNARRLDS